MKAIWRPAALADVARIASYIAEQNPIAAGRLARELVTVWPYIIVYRIDEAGDVRILRVWHGAQDRA